MVKTEHILFPVAKERKINLISEEKLETYLGKRIRVMCTDGESIEGMCELFTPAYDNEPEIAEISLKTKCYANGFICITSPEIKSIEVIE